MSGKINIAGLAASSRRRRGTSTLEFVLCIPLLALIIGTTFFFGWAMMNQQHVRASGRYTAWAQARGRGRAEGEHLNQKFFADKASSVSVSGAGGVDETLEDMVAAADQVSADAQLIADQIVARGCPRSISAEVAAGFPPKFLPWRALSGPIHDRYAREGLEWRRKQLGCEEIIRDAFLPELDGALRGLDRGPAAEFGQVLRRLYNQQW